MEYSEVREALPLRSETPAQWAALSLRDPLALLNDHAHLEKKAAANALELLCRWPHGAPPSQWVRALASIAAEEAEHLRIVSGLLLARGGSLSRHHKNPYAGRLHEAIRWGGGRQELADRLFVAALIEMRSCERFSILATEAEEVDLKELYASLLDSEMGHYHAFLRLASSLLSRDELESDWATWLEKESRIMEGAPSFCGILSGWSGATAKVG